MFGAFTIQSRQDFSLSSKHGFSERRGLVSQLKRAGGSRGLNRSKKVYMPKGCLGLHPIKTWTTVQPVHNLIPFSMVHNVFK